MVRSGGVGSQWSCGMWDVSRDMVGVLDPAVLFEDRTMESVPERVEPRPREAKCMG
jgi:hypothetical protein